MRWSGGDILRPMIDSLHADKYQIRCIRSSLSLGWLLGRSIPASLLVMWNLLEEPFQRLPFFFPIRVNNYIVGICDDFKMAKCISNSIKSDEKEKWAQNGSLVNSIGYGLGIRMFFSYANCLFFVEQIVSEKLFLDSLDSTAWQIVNNLGMA